MPIQFEIILQAGARRGRNLLAILVSTASFERDASSLKSPPSLFFFFRLRRIAMGLFLLVFGGAGFAPE